MNRAAALTRLTGNLALAVSTSGRHLGEDPLLFVVQAGRRLPPRLVCVLAGAVRRSGRTTGLRAAYGAWLAGDDADAETLLCAVPPEEGAHRDRGRAYRRLAGELAVQLGRTDLVPPDAPAVVHARALWSRGDLSLAMALLERSGTAPGLAARYRGELALLRQGGELRATAARSPGPPGPPGPPGHPVPSRVPDFRAGPTVLHVLTNSLPHSLSGYTVRTQAVLTAQRQAGIDARAVTRLAYPVVVGILGARACDIVDGVEYHRLLPWSLPRSPARRQAVQARLTTRFLHGTGVPDVLHTTTPFTNALVTRALARSFAVPWLYEVRGLHEETWVASRPTAAERRHAAAGERHRLWRARETDLAATADHVVTLSQTLRRELTGRGIAAGRISVIPNSVDAALLRTSISPAEARALVGLPPGGIWVGSVTSVVGYEGLEVLVEAVALARRGGTDLRLCIAGAGAALPALRLCVERAGLGDAAVLAGRVPRDRATLYQQALDAVALPRRDHRVCRVVTPLKLVEAMALARPVVASDLPALAEFVVASGGGELVPPEDPGELAARLVELADDPRRRRELAAAGREFASGLTWQAAGASYRKLYEALAGSA